MPFTPTHILAVVPIAAVARGRLPFAALAIGSMVPDLPLFLPGVANYQVTHSPWGLLTADLPLGLAGFLAWRLLYRDLLFALLPEVVRRRCAGPMRSGSGPTAGFALRAAVAVLIGASTHAAWDSFTHRDRTGTRLFPGLNATAFVLGGHPIPSYKVLQYGCTVVGLPLLATLSARWLRRQPPEPLDSLPTLPTAARVAAWAIALAIPIAVAGAVAARPNLSPYRKLGSAITGAGLIELVALTAASVAFRARGRWRTGHSPGIGRARTASDPSRAGEG